MKRRLLFSVFLICLACIFSSCSEHQYTISSGTYRMISSRDYFSIPYIVLDESDHTYYFIYDPLASTVDRGTYEVEGNILTCTSRNKNEKKYVFKATSNETLVFVQKDSSPVSRFNERIGVAVKDGAKFIRE